MTEPISLHCVFKISAFKGPVPDFYSSKKRNKVSLVLQYTKKKKIKHLCAVH